MTLAAAGLLSFDGLRRHMNDDWRHFGDRQPESDVAGGLFPWEHEFYAPHLRRTDHTREGGRFGDLCRGIRT